MPKKLGIIISGRGSNMNAVIEASRSGQIDAEVSIVISNKTVAKGLETAANFDIPTKAIIPKTFDSPARRI